MAPTTDCEIIYASEQCMLALAALMLLVHILQVALFTIDPGGTCSHLEIISSYYSAHSAGAQVECAHRLSFSIAFFT